MSELEFIHAYPTRLEAEQAQQYLENLGIDAMVQADDAGGMYAGLSFGKKGVRLLVRAEDADRANEALQPGVIIDPMVAAEAATRFFDQGNNCSEAVLRAFVADMGLDESVVQMATGFGGGHGREGDVCGSLSGAIMAVGLYLGRVDGADAEAKECCYEAVRELRRRFVGACGAIDCRDLIGEDLTTAEGRQRVEEQDLSTTVCRRCVHEAATIAAELISLAG